ACRDEHDASVRSHTERGLIVAPLYPLVYMSLSEQKLREIAGNIIFVVRIHSAKAWVIIPASPF
ncbi:MAG: hypothetical protein NWQ54_22985, partial [Paraglaciecola sp.]|nr:hypothetical protein [Paraglaciecola sp.]